MPGRLRLYRLGKLSYEDAYRWQLETADEVRDGADDALAVLQHPHTITLGRTARPAHLLLSRAELEHRGATVIESDRGGDITYHGPGQRVAYPVLNLRRLNLGAIDYVRILEETMLLTLLRFGLPGERIVGRPGVWVHGDKIGAIGVRIRGGVSTHGFALNVSPDLAWYDGIVPCGIAEAGVTSMTTLLGDSSPELSLVEDVVVEAFAGMMGYDSVEETTAQTSFAEAGVRQG